jgi:hypothetical protein
MTIFVAQDISDCNARASKEAILPPGEGNTWQDDVAAVAAVLTIAEPLVTVGGVGQAKVNLASSEPATGKAHGVQFVPNLGPRTVYFGQADGNEMFWNVAEHDLLGIKLSERNVIVVERLERRSIRWQILGSR